MKKLLRKLSQMFEADALDLNDLTYFMDKEMDVELAKGGNDHFHVMYAIGGSHDVATSCPLARQRRLRECTKMVYLKGGMS